MPLAVTGDTYPIVNDIVSLSKALLGSVQFLTRSPYSLMPWNSSTDLSYTKSYTVMKSILVVPVTFSVSSTVLPGTAAELLSSKLISELIASSFLQTA